MFFQEEPHRHPSQTWIRPSLSVLAKADSGFPLSSAGDHARVLLVDEPNRLPDQAAAELAGAGLHVVQATGVSGALAMARRFAINLLVIGGDRRYENIWRCAGKLCGPPPWHGVVLYLSDVTAGDRLWGTASQVTDLVETRGQPEPLVRAVLRCFGWSAADTDRHLSRIRGRRPGRGPGRDTTPQPKVPRAASIPHWRKNG